MAATRHYITEETLPICDDVVDTQGPYVVVADGSIMTPTKTGILPLSSRLTCEAKVVYGFDNLKRNIDFHWSIM